MAWVEVKKPNDPFTVTITDEVYEGIYRLQGYEIVNKPEDNAPKNVSTAQSAEVDKSIKPTPKTPVKRQYTRHTANGDK